MRLNFWLMVSSFILSFYSTQFTALGASELKYSCNQALAVSVGEKDILEKGALIEIASSYGDTIWESIQQIQPLSSNQEGGLEWDQKKEVIDEIELEVHEKFVANLRSSHFLLGMIDRASKSTQKLGLSQRGADLALVLAVATPMLGVIGDASWTLYSQGDIVSSLGLPTAAAGIGLIFASGYRGVKNRIRGQSLILMALFGDLVIAKLGKRLLEESISIGSEPGEELTRLREQVELWTKRRATRRIIDAAIEWHLKRKLPLDSLANKWAKQPFDFIGQTVSKRVPDEGFQSEPFDIDEGPRINKSKRPDADSK